MSIPPIFLLDVLSNLLNTDSYYYPAFGLEFFSLSEDKLNHPSINGIVVSPFVSLKTALFMKEHDLNSAVSILPLSPLSSTPPFSPEDYELLRVLITNNYTTFVLSDQWLFSPVGAMYYFAKILGIDNLSHTILDVSENDQIVIWRSEHIEFHDFLSSLSNLSETWFAYPHSSTPNLSPFVLSLGPISVSDIDLLKREGVNTVFSFSYNSTLLRQLQKSKMAFVFLDYWDFCNISLRKFSQILQLEVDIPVYFFQQGFPNWLTKSSLEQTS